MRILPRNNFDCLVWSRTPWLARNEIFQIHPLCWLCFATELNVESCVTAVKVLLFLPTIAIKCFYFWKPKKRHRPRSNREWAPFPSTLRGNAHFLQEVVLGHHSRAWDLVWTGFRQFTYIFAVFLCHPSSGQNGGGRSIDKRENHCIHWALGYGTGRNGHP